MPKKYNQQEDMNVKKQNEDTSVVHRAAAITHVCWKTRMKRPTAQLLWKTVNCWHYTIFM